jgi:hypothetical protein
MELPPTATRTPLHRWRLDWGRWWKQCDACDRCVELTGQNPADYLGPHRCKPCESVDAADDA